MSSLRKLPPQVARELRRHISPKPLPKQPGKLSPELEQQRQNNLSYILAGLVAFTGTAASFPLLATWWVGNLNEKEDPLTAPQVRRGAFLNSGTKDVGRDPNWDFQKGQYKKDAGYYAIFEEEKKKQLPGEFLAMPANDLQKHQQGIEAFAKGEKKNRS